MKNFILEFKSQPIPLQYSYILGVLICLYYFTFGCLIKVVICDSRDDGKAMAALCDVGYIVVSNTNPEGGYPHMTLPTTESIEDLKSIVDWGFSCGIKSFEMSKSPILSLTLLKHTSEEFKPCWTVEDIAKFKKFKYRSEAIEFIKMKYESDCEDLKREESLLTRVE